MAFDKPFLDLDKQLNLLESRKLIITNRDRAKRLIMTSSYYDLINGYKSVFMLSNDRFKDNVKLEDIYIFSSGIFPSGVNYYFCQFTNIDISQI